MIVKDLDEFTATADPLARAGRKAEEQMAFYLRRAFADDPTIILNGMRLERDGDAAQIDHLVVSTWGFVIVESKSITTRVRVNDHGEWMRWYDGHWHGMASPVLQAQRQADFLRAYLQGYSGELRDKTLLRRRDFSTIPIALLVAISDSAIVERPRTMRIDEVCKADQAPGQLRDMLDASRRESKAFSQAELERITTFLVDHHRPGRTQPRQMRVSAEAREPYTTRPAASPPQAASAARCRHCNGTDIEVRAGRYGPYFKCHQCQGNTHIDTTCARCGAKGTVRKNGIYVLADCQRCHTSTVLGAVHTTTIEDAGRA